MEAGQVTLENGFPTCRDGDRQFRGQSTVQKPRGCDHVAHTKCPESCLLRSLGWATAAGTEAVSGVGLVTGSPPLSTCGQGFVHAV